ncbi:MAG: hypothetical protein H6Q67_703 [Firmicutes bacterium]|nr:hypothetical protein [Bacillota bacterium]
MKIIDTKVLVRTALLLALTLLFQWSRFLLPVPPVFSTIVTGTLVNACLVIAAGSISLYSAAVIGIVAPIVAYFQGLLPLPVFVFPIALANFFYVAILSAVKRNIWLSISIASVVKAGALYVIFLWLLTWINIDSKVATGILFIMSWPQLFTAAMGAVLATLVVRRAGHWVK